MPSLTPPNFLIRPLTAQDEPVVWEMLYHAIHVPAGQAPPPRCIVEEPGLAHYARGWGQRPGDLGMALVEQIPARPVGAAWLRLFTRDDPGYGYIDDATPELSIALLPEYRGQGLGSRLMQALLQAAAGQYRAVSLSVSPGNAAENLYHRLGFVVTERTDASLTMRKSLERQTGI